MTKYFLGKIESSAKVKVGMNVILGPSHQLIIMGLSGFKVKQNLKDKISEESHPFSIIKLKHFLNVVIM